MLAPSLECSQVEIRDMDNLETIERSWKIVKCKVYVLYTHLGKAESKSINVCYHYESDEKQTNIMRWVCVMNFLTNQPMDEKRAKMAFGPTTRPINTR